MSPSSTLYSPFAQRSIHCASFASASCRSSSTCLSCSCLSSFITLLDRLTEAVNLSQRALGPARQDRQCNFHAIRHIAHCPLYAKHSTAFRSPLPYLMSFQFVVKALSTHDNLCRFAGSAMLQELR